MIQARFTDNQIKQFLRAFKDYFIFLEKKLVNAIGYKITDQGAMYFVGYSKSKDSRRWIAAGCNFL